MWAYSVCQWNCIARSINIDVLTFDQFAIGMDSIIIEFLTANVIKLARKQYQRTVLQTHSI